MTEVLPTVVTQRACASPCDVAIWRLAGRNHWTICHWVPCHRRWKTKLQWLPHGLPRQLKNRALPGALCVCQFSDRRSKWKKLDSKKLLKRKINPTRVVTEGGRSAELPRKADSVCLTLFHASRISLFNYPESTRFKLIRPCGYCKIGGRHPFTHSMHGGFKIWV